MKKDLVKTIRVNSEIMKALEKKGWTIQKLVDDAIAKKVKVKTTIEVRSH